MPRSLGWDHNAHYHGELLRQLPAPIDRALDIGCGAGDFARKLATRSHTVDAIDTSPEMIASARAAAPRITNINWIEGDVLSLDLPAGAYDAVAAIASLHHMPLDAALRRFSELVHPGGTVAVLGLYRAEAPGDYALAAVAMAANPAVGAWKAALGRRATPYGNMPVLDAPATMSEIKAAASKRMAGAVIRRHVFFRYSLIWRRGPER
jgi:ubiquinone/menaquinone biosynthesis C-methylase UbiE